MPRILHVLDHSLPLHSGYTFRTRAIMKAQEADGHEVRAITGLRQGSHTAADGAPEEHAGLIFHRTRGAPSGRAGWREWREIAALAKAIDDVCEQWRPDVFHAHSPALCGLAAARVAKARGIPLVYEIRAFWEDAASGNGTGADGTVKYWLTRRLENRAIARASAVVTICRGLRDDLIARGVAPAKISTVANGVDLALFGEPLQRDLALARELGFDASHEGGPVIGFVGSFYPYEGVDDLIAAMPALLVAHPAAKLLLVGGGPSEAALRAQAAASSAAGAIRFVGRVPHEAVQRYYSLIDVVAYPRKAMRLTELVTPLKPLEAMAQGKIVAASDVGGHRELIADGLTGTLFVPDDPVDLARALAILLWRQSEWPHQRIASRRAVERDHDWARNVLHYRDVYQRVLDPLGTQTEPA
ncbi:TIGR04063 family PEP-CTERM/XrtA system glycosyltransferase [Novosphingobium sp. Gsoil 351]|uniref:TIGR04063 family PEP-CTERM/XrtA system glycosyltransferase n=1 Tax=Novosphingobium sp. Gsoil 351 TaxID=2675225 RepID=UPI0012B488CF|nr:TIGR04063 family PEP-CTERM/XrtA system glycosyltransferase [Novosphingobium sp. Gsoil 351]QGN54726.1 glycosyltransferase, exosortase A system-associated [Novosphingobium sp. Gsoil 351]